MEKRGFYVAEVMLWSGSGPRPGAAVMSALKDRLRAALEALSKLAQVGDIRVCASKNLISEKLDVGAKGIRMELTTEQNVEKELRVKEEAIRLGKALKKAPVSKSKKAPRV